MSWQSDEMKDALEGTDPIDRLIDVFELLHPLPLSDSKHGFVDVPQLIREAHAASKARRTKIEKE